MTTLLVYPLRALRISPTPVGAVLRRWRLMAAGLCAAAGTMAQQPTGSLQLPLPPLPAAYPAELRVNYVRTWAARTAISDTSAAALGNAALYSMATAYYDGLGRPLQTVLRGATTDGTGDRIQAYRYDGYDRQPRQYLPYTAAPGAAGAGKFHTTAFAEQQQFYQTLYKEQYPFAQQQYEASPLGRVHTSLPPGNDWSGSGRGVQTAMGIATTADSVWMLGVNDAGNAVFEGYYPAGRLYRQQLTDEQGQVSCSYTTPGGQLILKKVLVALPAVAGGPQQAGWHYTYYIYDELDRLAAVWSPGAVDAIAPGIAAQGMGWSMPAAIADGLCYAYRYDGRGRQVEKKIPGAAPVYMVYDARDRLVLTQDGVQRSKGQWLYTRYDALNRPVATGLWVNSQSLAAHVAMADTSLAYPTLQAAGQTVTELTRSFYDQYDWLATQGATLPFTNQRSTIDDGGLLAADDASYPYPQALQQSMATTTLVTGTAVRIPGSQSAAAPGGTWLYSILYYDQQGRVIQVQSQNHKGGVNTTTTQYGWDGRVLRTVQRHTTATANGSTTQTHILRTRMGYKPNGMRESVEQQVESRVGTDTPIVSGLPNGQASWKYVQRQLYNALGQLWVKGVGNNPRYSDYHAVAEQMYHYNIRGWLTGINKNWLNNVGADDRLFFAMELGYDKDGLLSPYTQKQYNGNIAGTVWSSVGDREIRKYDFKYDGANRLISADFTQYNPVAGGNSFNKSAGVDFSVVMGDDTIPAATGGTHRPYTAYDANGNILRMRQWGLKGNASVLIDDLRYQYRGQSNQLVRVTDSVSDPLTKLGDFKDGSPAGSGDDYGYDDNGSMTSDQNKRITAIEYNYLNLPQRIVIAAQPAANGNPALAGGTIEYWYDAAGVKLRKVVKETGRPDKTTDYISGAVYENDTLQLMSQEEGRVRPLRNLTGVLTGFAFDYFLKDHLGNVRAVVTDELQQDIYPAATLEPGLVGTERGFYNIDTTKIVPNVMANDLRDAYGNTQAYPNNNTVIANNNPGCGTGALCTTASSGYVYQLNGNSNKTGLGIVLKVMAGDKLSVAGKSYYNQNTTGTGGNSPLPFVDILSGFLGSASGIGGMHSGITPAQINPGTSNATVNGFLSDQSTQSNSNQTRPKAFVNVLFFDEQFKLAGYKLSMVGNNKELKRHLAELQNIAVPKNGFVYIYCSNESPVNVFFDNLQVVHDRGALLEETHYYPFGLVMSGISSRAAGKLDNKYQYGGKEKQDKEFSDGSGLELLDFGARMQDPQLGRFWQIDPKCELFQPYTPYNYCLNSPVLFVDPDGMQAKYNWCTGRYQENGRDVSWEDVKASNGFGEYASTVSVFLTQKYTDDTKTALKDDGTGGLWGDLNYFLRASKGNTSCKLIQAKDENDAANQIDQISQPIDNLYISSHGGSTVSSFWIGSTAYTSEFHIRDSKALERISKKMYSASGLVKGLPLATVTIAACYSSKTKDGESMIQAVADVFHAVTLAPYELCYPSHFDGNKKNKVSSWKLFLPSVYTDHSIRPINVYHVYFDNTARVHYDFEKE
jgi:RHS repeat-associated protein